MTKPFMPPLNSKWRFSADWAMPHDAMLRYENMDFKKSVGPGQIMSASEWLDVHPEKRTAGQAWVPEYHAYVAEETNKTPGVPFPKGTVVSFNRYHASNSGTVEITLQCITSPNLFITPKKMGGKGKGKLRFYLDIEEFNSLPELEFVE